MDENPFDADRKDVVARGSVRFLAKKIPQEGGRGSESGSCLGEWLQCVAVSGDEHTERGSCSIQSAGNEIMYFHHQGLPTCHPDVQSVCGITHSNGRNHGQDCFLIRHNPGISGVIAEVNYFRSKNEHPPFRDKINAFREENGIVCLRKTISSAVYVSKIRFQTAGGFHEEPVGSEPLEHLPSFPNPLLYRYPSSHPFWVCRDFLGYKKRRELGEIVGKPGNRFHEFDASDGDAGL